MSRAGNQRETGGAFGKQINWALTATGVTARDKVVLIYLITRARRFDLDAWPSLTTIAAGTALTVPAVCKSNKNLERAGLIRVTRRGKSNYYEIQYPAE